MLVEVLTFEGCPHGEAAVAFVRRVVSEAGVLADVVVIDVAVESVVATRFLGSPTVRVDGHDVEPGATLRTDYARACRLHRTEAGLRPLPEARWLLAAVQPSTSN